MFLEKIDIVGDVCVVRQYRCDVKHRGYTARQTRVFVRLIKLNRD